MPDRFGPRGVFAIMIPLQNANMQPEYESMRPAGISNQIYRFDISDAGDVAEAMIAVLPGARLCWPDMIICGNSVEMRGWSVARQADYRARVTEAGGGVPVVTATDACQAALVTLGARRIAILSPMSEAHSASVKGYYTELGFEVPHTTWLDVRHSEDIIRVPPQTVEAAFDRLDHDDVDTFLHVGGALGIVDLVDDLEKRLGRPVVSVNAATYWYALRRHGIADPLDRGGRLTRLSLPAQFASDGPSR